MIKNGKGKRSCLTQEKIWVEKNQEALHTVWKCSVTRTVVPLGPFWALGPACTRAVRKREAAPRRGMLWQRCATSPRSNNGSNTLAKAWATVTGVCKHPQHDLPPFTGVPWVAGVPRVAAGSEGSDAKPGESPQRPRQDKPLFKDS